MLWHYTELKQVWLAEHIPVDVELSRSRHRTGGRRLAGDAVDAICQENRVIVYRRQAASHGPLFAARQRYVEDVVAPPTGSAVPLNPA